MKKEFYKNIEQGRECFLLELSWDASQFCARSWAKNLTCSISFNFSNSLFSAILTFPPHRQENGAQGNKTLCRVCREGSRDKGPRPVSYRRWGDWDLTSGKQLQTDVPLQLHHPTILLDNSPRSQGWCGREVAGPSGLLAKRLVQFNLPLISDCYSH